MSVEITTAKVTYNTDGIQDTFPITFDYDTNEVILVVLREISTGNQTTLVEVTDYEVDGNNIVMNTVYSTGYTLTILRNMPFKQLTDYRPEEPLQSEVLEYDFDKVVKYIQMLEEQAGRTLTLPISSPYGDLELPEPEDGYIMMWDGGTLVNVKWLNDPAITITAFMEALLALATAEAARDHLGFYTPSDDTWHEVGAGGEPAFQNSWENSGGTYATMAFRIDTDRVVHFKGRIQGGTPNSIIFQLPTGYRPSKKLRYTVPGKDDRFEILVDEDGNVWHYETNDAEQFEIPVGFVLLYDGLNIVAADTRTEKLGDRVGDADFSLLLGDWYVCNGQSGTPDLRDTFIRMESAKGNTGGSDTHTLTIGQMPSHDHSLTITGAGGAVVALTAAVQASQSTTTGNRGGGNAHNNMPAYYSLIPIKRLA